MAQSERDELELWCFQQKYGPQVEDPKEFVRHLSDLITTRETQARRAALQQAHASLQALRYEKGSLSAVQIETAFRKLLAEIPEHVQA